MIHLLVLKNVPIFEQLRLEEALLRADQRNFCIINSGSPDAIVMGISAKVDDVVHSHNPLPIIRRYSGGGTVVIEPSTFLVSWILNHEALDASPYPRDVMQWSAKLLPDLFPNIPLQLQENDYVIGERKCGGNAQYFVKGRLVHHSSFLWDYNPEKMNYLKMPPKMPKYRNERPHDQFVCTLKEHVPHMGELQKKFIQGLGFHFPIKEIGYADVREVLTRPHRTSSTHL